MTSAPLTQEDIARMDEVAAPTSDIAAIVQEVKIWRDLWGGLSDDGLVHVTHEDGECAIYVTKRNVDMVIIPNDETAAFLAALRQETDT